MYVQFLPHCLHHHIFFIAVKLSNLITFAFAVLGGNSTSSLNVIQLKAYRNQAFVRSESSGEEPGVAATE